MRQHNSFRESRLVIGERAPLRVAAKRIGCRVACPRLFAWAWAIKQSVSALAGRLSIGQDARYHRT